MMYVHYEQAVEAMTKGLSRFMRSENAKHFAEIFIKFFAFIVFY